MAFVGGWDRTKRLSFTRNELTGAIGDTITVIPLVIALALLTDISLPHVLILFGIFQVVWGVVYGLPVSVEPMKALAALAIAGTLTYAEFALAGIVLGVVLLAMGITGSISTIERWIGEPVIRGVQLAVGLLLLEVGVRLAIEDFVLAGVGVALTVLVVLVGFKNASALVVLAIGIGLTLVTVGVPTPRWPGWPPIVDVSSGLTRATVDGIVAQTAMTIGNAALATSLMFADLFDEDVSPDDLSTSMGLTNLVAVPVGGIPMCHGCDGVAGKYEFGARTGGANVLLGGMYVVAAFFATTLILGAFPLALLGVLLVIVAGTLGKSVLQSTNLWLSAGIGILAVLTNLGLAFVLGILVHQVFARR